MVNLGAELYLALLEEGEMSYEEYCNHVPAYNRPKEYKTYALFLKNRGAASKRIAKEDEWKANAVIREAEENWRQITGKRTSK